MWPAMCRNRSVEILKDRPDLVDQMNKFRIKIDNVLKIICRKHFQVDGTYMMSGVRLLNNRGKITKKARTYSDNGIFNFL